MNCYCKERESNPKLAKEMKDIPTGFCGLCEICGKPGHMSAHPRLSTTGVWCRKHWDDLIKYRIFTLGDIVQSIFYMVIIGIALYSIASIWEMFFE